MWIDLKQNKNKKNTWTISNRKFWIVSEARGDAIATA